MSTTKTRTIAVRVPTEIAEALQQDADELNTTPGKLLRTMLEGRYSLRREARISKVDARNLDIVRLT